MAGHTTQTRYEGALMDLVRSHADRFHPGLRIHACCRADIARVLGFTVSSKEYERLRQ